jgi:serine phosphatase RsbU (regulator of sigma subunit)
MRSVKFKLALAISLFTTLTLGALAYVILVQSRDALLIETSSRGILIGSNLASNSASALLQKDLLGTARLVSEAMKNEGVAYAVLVNEEGFVAASHDLEAVGQAYSPPPGQPFAVEGLSLPEGAALTLSGAKSEILSFSFPVSRSGVNLGIAYLGMTQSRIEQVVAALTRDVMVLAGAFLAFGFLGAVLLATVITRPVSRLMSGAEAIGKGDLSVRIKVRSRDELGRLAQSFNEMAANLKVAQEEALKKSLFDRDLSIARDIQTRLIPKVIPKLLGYSVVGHYQPAQEVGGDYYDVLDLGDSRLALAVADVSGKGVPGSLGMAMTRSEFRLHATQCESLGEAIARTNKGIYPEFAGNLFVTLFHAVIDGKTHNLRCASAGHNPAYLVRASGRIEEVNPPGPALGVFSSGAFRAEESSLAMEKDDLLVLYTDGVTEAKNPSQDEYGEDRLMSLLKRNARGSVDAVKEAILADVNAFATGAPQHDDITLLLLRRDR